MAVMRLATIVMMVACATGCGDDSSESSNARAPDAGADAVNADAPDAGVSRDTAAADTTKGDTGWLPASGDKCTEHRYTFLEGADENPASVRVPFYHSPIPSGADWGMYLEKIDVPVERLGTVKSIHFDMGGEVDFNIGPKFYRQDAFEFHEDNGPLESVRDRNVIEFSFRGALGASDFPGEAIAITITLEDGRGTYSGVEVTARYRCWSR